MSDNDFGLSLDSLQGLADSIPEQKKARLKQATIDKAKRLDIESDVKNYSPELDVLGFEAARIKTQAEERAGVEYGTFDEQTALDQELGYAEDRLKLDAGNFSGMQSMAGAAERRDKYYEREYGAARNQMRKEREYYAKKHQDEDALFDTDTTLGYAGDLGVRAMTGVIGAAEGLTGIAADITGSEVIDRIRTNLSRSHDYLSNKVDTRNTDAFYNEAKEGFQEAFSEDNNAVETLGGIIGTIATTIFDNPEAIPQLMADSAVYMLGAAPLKAGLTGAAKLAAQTTRNRKVAAGFAGQLASIYQNSFDENRENFIREHNAVPSDTDMAELRMTTALAALSDLAGDRLMGKALSKAGLQHPTSKIGGMFAAGAGEAVAEGSASLLNAAAGKGGITNLNQEDAVEALTASTMGAGSGMGAGAPRAALEAIDAGVGVAKNPIQSINKMKDAKQAYKVKGHVKHFNKEENLNTLTEIDEQASNLVNARIHPEKAFAEISELLNEGKKDEAEAVINKLAEDNSAEKTRQAKKSLQKRLEDTENPPTKAEAKSIERALDILNTKELAVNTRALARGFLNTSDALPEEMETDEATGIEDTDIEDTDIEEDVTVDENVINDTTEDIINQIENTEVKELAASVLDDLPRNEDGTYEVLTKEEMEEVIASSHKDYSGNKTGEVADTLVDIVDTVQNLVNLGKPKSSTKGKKGNVSGSDSGTNTTNRDSKNPAPAKKVPLKNPNPNPDNISEKDLLYSYDADTVSNVSNKFNSKSVKGRDLDQYTVLTDEQYQERKDLIENDSNITDEQKQEDLKNLDELKKSMYEQAYFAEAAGREILAEDHGDKEDGGYSLGNVPSNNTDHYEKGANDILTDRAPNDNLRDQTQKVLGFFKKISSQIAAAEKTAEDFENNRPEDKKGKPSTASTTVMTLKSFKDYSGYLAKATAAGSVDGIGRLVDHLKTWLDTNDPDTGMTPEVKEAKELTRKVLEELIQTAEDSYKIATVEKAPSAQAKKVEEEIKNFVATAKEAFVKRIRPDLYKYTTKFQKLLDHAKSLVNPLTGEKAESKDTTDSSSSSSTSTSQNDPKVEKATKKSRKANLDAVKNEQKYALPYLDVFVKVLERNKKGQPIRVVVVESNSRHANKLETENESKGSIQRIPKLQVGDIIESIQITQDGKNRDDNYYKKSSKSNNRNKYTQTNLLTSFIEKYVDITKGKTFVVKHADGTENVYKIDGARSNEDKGSNTETLAKDSIKLNQKFAKEDPKSKVFKDAKTKVEKEQDDKNKEVTKTNRENAYTTFKNVVFLFGAKQSAKVYVDLLTAFKIPVSSYPYDNLTKRAQGYAQVANRVGDILSALHTKRVGYEIELEKAIADNIEGDIISTKDLLAKQQKVISEIEKALDNLEPHVTGKTVVGTQIKNAPTIGKTLIKNAKDLIKNFTPNIGELIFTDDGKVETTESLFENEYYFTKAAAKNIRETQGREPTKEDLQAARELFRFSEYFHKQLTAGFHNVNIQGTKMGLNTTGVSILDSVLADATQHEQRQILAVMTFLQTEHGDEQGVHQIPRAVTFAMAAGSMDWLANASVFNDRNSVAKMLGMPKDPGEHDAKFNAVYETYYAHKGVLLKNAARDIGGFAMLSLGVELDKHNISATYTEEIRAGLGLLSYATLETMSPNDNGKGRYVFKDTVSNKIHTKNLRTFKGASGVESAADADAQVIFVRPDVDSKNKYRPSKHVRSLIRPYKEKAPGVIDAIYGGREKDLLPAFEPEKAKVDLYEKYGIRVPADIGASVHELTQVPWRLDSTLVKTLLAEDGELEIFKMFYGVPADFELKDLEEKTIKALANTDYNDLQKKREYTIAGVAQEILALKAALQELQTKAGETVDLSTKDLFFSYDIWVQGRIGVGNTDFNFQNSKIARAFVHPVSPDALVSVKALIADTNKVYYRAFSSWLGIDEKSNSAMAEAVTNKSKEFLENLPDGLVKELEVHLDPNNDLPLSERSKEIARILKEYNVKELLDAPYTPERIGEFPPATVSELTSWLQLKDNSNETEARIEAIKDIVENTELSFEDRAAALNTYLNSNNIPGPYGNYHTKDVLLDFLKGKLVESTTSDVDIPLSGDSDTFNFATEIANYSNMKSGKISEFESKIVVEIDGITSGFGILMTQMGLLNNAYTHLARVGMYTEQSGLQKYSDFRSTYGARDSYQNIMGNALAFSSDFLQEEAANNKSKIRSKFGKENKNSRRDSEAIADDILDNFERFLDVIVGKGAVARTASDAISKVGRDIAKPGFMTTNYQASIDSVKKDIVTLFPTFLSQKLDKIMKEPDDVKRREMLAEISPVLSDFNITFKKAKKSKGKTKNRNKSGQAKYETESTTTIEELLKNPEWGSAKDVQALVYSKEAKANLDLLGKILSEGVGGSIRQELGPTERARALVNSTFQVQYELFNIAFDKKIKDLVDKNNRPPTKAELDIVIKQLEPLVPSYLGFAGKSQGSIERFALFRMEAVTGKDGSITINFNRRMRENGKDLESISTPPITKKMVSVGVGGPALLVQNVDAAVMTEIAKAVQDVMHVHDAIKGAPFNIDLKGREANKAFYNVTKNVDIVGDARESLARSIEAYADIVGIPGKGAGEVLTEIQASTIVGLAVGNRLENAKVVSHESIYLDVFYGEDALQDTNTEYDFSQIPRLITMLTKLRKERDDILANPMHPNQKEALDAINAQIKDKIHSPMQIMGRNYIASLGRLHSETQVFRSTVYSEIKFVNQYAGAVDGTTYEVSDAERNTPPKVVKVKYFMGHYESNSEVIPIPSPKEVEAHVLEIMLKETQSRTVERKQKGGLDTDVFNILSEIVREEDIKDEDGNLIYAEKTVIPAKKHSAKKVRSSRKLNSPVINRKARTTPAKTIEEFLSISRVKALYTILTANSKDKEEKQSVITAFEKSKGTKVKLLFANYKDDVRDETIKKLRDLVNKADTPEKFNDINETLSRVRDNLNNLPSKGVNLNTNTKQFISDISEIFDYVEKKKKQNIAQTAFDNRGTIDKTVDYSTEALQAKSKEELKVILEDIDKIPEYGRSKEDRRIYTDILEILQSDKPLFNVPSATNLTLSEIIQFSINESTYSPEVQVTDAELTAENVHEHFDIIRTYDSQPISEEAQNAIDNFVNKLLAPSLDFLGSLGLTQVTGTNLVDQNIGGYNPDKRTIATVAPSRIVALGSMSLQEVTAHEAAHSVWHHILVHSKDAARELAEFRDIMRKSFTRDELVSRMTPAGAPRSIGEARYDYIFNNDEAMKGHSWGKGLEEFAAYLSTNGEFISAAKEVTAVPTFKVKGNNLFANFFNYMMENVAALLAWIAGGKHRHGSVYEAGMALGVDTLKALQQPVSEVRRNVISRSFTKALDAVNNLDNKGANLIERGKNSVLGKFGEGENMLQNYAEAKEKDPNDLDIAEEQTIRHLEFSKEVSMRYVKKVVLNNTKDLSPKERQAILEQLENYFELHGTSTGSVKNFMLLVMNLHVDTNSELQYIYEAFFGGNQNKEAVRRLYRKYKYSVDVEGARYKQAIVEDLQRSLKDRTKEDLIFLAEEFLDTDLGYLKTAYDLSEEELYNLIGNPAQVQAYIEKEEARLRSDTDIYANSFIAQAKGLAHHMKDKTRGVANQMANAYMIVNGDYLGGFIDPDLKVGILGEDTKLVVESVDKLASLYALKNMTSSARANLKRIFKEEATKGFENNGMTSILDYAAGMRLAYTEFSGSSEASTLPKGFTKAMYKNNLEFETVALKDVKGKENQGWATTGERRSILGKDFVLMSRRIYENNAQNGMLGSLSLNALANTDIPLSKIANIHAENYSDVDSALKIMNRKVRDKLTQEAFNEQFHNPDPEIRDLPVLASMSPEGELMGYYAPLGSDVINGSLQRENNIIEVLGDTTAHIARINKTSSVNGTPGINEDVLSVLALDHYENKDTDGTDFIMINDQEYTYEGKPNKYRDAYLRLPASVKETAKEIWGSQGIPVRRSQVRLVFGYDRVMLSDWEPIKVLDELVGDKVQVQRIARAVDEVYRELVGIAKNTIVLKTYDVIVGNINSNIVHAILHGVNPLDIPELMTKGILELKKYEKMDKEIKQLRLKLSNASSKQWKEYSARISDITQRQQALSIHDMMSRNMNTSIRQNADLTDVSSGRIAELAEKAKNLSEGNILTKSAFRVGSEIFMAEGSTAHAVAAEVTRYSDVVGRYVILEGLKKRNAKLPQAKRKTDSEITEIVFNAFVEYDFPLPENIDTAEAYGLLMFVKYFLGIQRSLHFVGTERLATSSSFLAANAMLDLNLSHALNANLLVKDYSNLLYNPYDTITNIFSPKLLTEYILPAFKS